MPPIIPALGWRWAFDVCGLIGIAYALPLFLLLRRAVPAAQSREALPDSTSVAAESIGPGRAARELLGNGSFLLLVGYFTLPALAAWIVRDWMPAILKAEFGIGQGLAGVSATLYWQLAAIAGAIGGGWLADRWMRRSPRGRINTSALSMAFIVPAMFGVGYAPETGLLWVAIVFLILFGLGWGIFDANNMPILSQIVRPSLRATGYGIMNLVSISCGGFADWGFGLLRDRHVPLFGIFGVFAGVAVLSALLVLLIRPRRYRDCHDPYRPLHEFVAATHSPFRADGALALEVVPIQAAFLAANGVRTVFVSGTTGECHSMTCDERLALSEAWAAAGPAHGLHGDRARRQPRHRGCPAAGAAAGDARAGGDQHAGAVVLQAAHADRPDRLVRGDRRRGAGAAVLLLRHPVDDPGVVPDRAVPRRGIGPDPHARRRQGEQPGFRLLPARPRRRGRSLRSALGADEALLAALATGARGGVGSTYNWAHPLYVALRDAFEPRRSGRGAAPPVAVDRDDRRDRRDRLHGHVEGADGPPGRPGRPGAPATRQPERRRG